MPSEQDTSCKSSKAAILGQPSSEKPSSKKLSLIINNPMHNNKENNSKEGSNKKTTLHDCVCSVLTDYIKDLDGHSVSDLYQLVLNEVEPPLLQTILKHSNGNQSKAAQMLGINRGTLRKKLKQYNINE